MSKEVTKPTVITKKLQMDIPEELHKRFKVLCAMNDTTMIEVLKPFIEKWCDEHDKAWMKK